jgi:spore maturation protein CgeB
MSGKIRFLKTTSNYPNYISAFMRKHPEMNSLSYDEALSRYLADCYAWADFWKINLEATGKFECTEIVENVELLQKKWAQEHSVAYNEENWQNEILTEQIKFYKPDILFLVDLYNDNSLAKTIKKEVPSIKFILGWDGILWHKPETYSDVDIILTCVPETAEFYKSKGKKSYYHKFGFETTVTNRLTKFPHPYNVSFTGSLVLAKNYHMGRLKLVAELSRRVDLNIWASSLPVNWSLFEWSRLKETIKGGDYRFNLDLHRVGSRNKGEVFGLDMFNVLHNSRIVFNTHGDNSIKTAANMRMTEATGVGSLLLTDWKENLHELFVPDEEVVAYKSTDEAVDKIKMLLNNEPLRAKIAKKGQERTFRDYSYRQRMSELADFLYNYL